MSQDKRARLKSAIADYNMQHCKVERQKRAIELAQQAFADAKAELESFSDLDKQITRFRVAATKRGANAKNLPEDLRTRVDGKKAAQDELTQAQGTLEELETEFKELQKTLQPLLEARVAAARNVLVEEQGDAIAKEYMQAAARAKELFLQLGGLLAIGVATQPMATAGALGSNDSIIIRQSYPEGTDIFSDMGSRWEKRIHALVADSETAITRPKPILVNDYTRTNPVAAHFGIPLPAEYKVTPE